MNFGLKCQKNRHGASKRVIYLSDLPELVSQEKNDPITGVEHKSDGCLILAGSRRRR